MSVQLLRAAFTFGSRGPLALAGATVCAVYLWVLFPAASRRSGSVENRVQDLQQARTPDAFAGVLQGWCTTHDHAVAILKRDNLLALDTSFPALYALTLAFSYAWLAGARRPSRLDLFFFVAPCIAGLFDYVENALELFLLRGIDTRQDVLAAIAGHAFDPRLVSAAFAASSLKFAWLGVGLVGILFGVVRRCGPLVKVAAMS